MVLSLRTSASQTHHTQYQLTTNLTSSFELGSPVQFIYTHHPKRTLHEVHYARHVEMPNGLSLPLAFGVNTRLLGFGR